MSDSIEKVFESLNSMKISDVVLLVKKLEESWGVSASASVVASGNFSQDEKSSESSEKTSFDVTLLDSGSSKIAVIKEVRAIVSGLGLAEAKALVESTPKLIKSNLKKEEAEEIKKKLEAVGAKVEVK